MQIRNLKNDHELRHEKEIEYVKERFRAKHQLVMDKIEEENNQLIE